MNRLPLEPEPARQVALPHQVLTLIDDRGAAVTVRPDTQSGPFR